MGIASNVSNRVGIGLCPSLLERPCLIDLRALFIPISISLLDRIRISLKKFCADKFSAADFHNRSAFVLADPGIVSCSATPNATGFVVVKSRSQFAVQCLPRNLNSVICNEFRPAHLASPLRVVRVDVDLNRFVTTCSRIEFARVCMALNE